MHITIIGASAGVGLETVKLALQRNHTVTTLSRSNPNLPVHPRLHTLTGSATDIDELGKSIEQADAVIIAIGTGNSTKPTTLYSDLAKRLVELQQRTNTPIPFIILTGFGAGESGRYNSWWMKLLFKLILKDVYADKTSMEEIIAGSSMNWELVRPGRLTDKPITGKYRIETTLFRGMHIGSIHRADVADFLVKQAEHSTYIHQYPALSNQ